MARNGYLARIMATAAIYSAMAIAGALVFDLGLGFSFVWMPAGLSLAAVFLFGHRMWPAIAGAAFFFSLLSSLLAGLPIPASLLASVMVSAGSTSAALAGVYLLKRFTPGINPLSHTKDYLQFVLLAAFLANAMGSTVQVLGLSLSGIAAWADFASLWTFVWTGSVASTLIVTVIILAWAYESRLSRHPLQIIKALLPLALAVVSLQIILMRSTPGGATPPEVGLLIPPFIASLIWAAIKLGPRGISTALFLTWMIALWNTDRGVGSLVLESDSLSFLMVQASWTALTIVIMIPAASIAEGKDFARKLQGAKNELETRAADLALLNEKLQLETVERQKAEDQERHQRQNYEALLNAQSELGQGLTVVDIVNQKLLFANEAFCRMSGYSLEELQALGSLFSLIPSDKQQAMQNDLQKRLSGEPMSNILEASLLRKDGGLLDIEVGIQELTPGDQKQLLAVSRDISERKQAEEELSRAMAELERSNTELQQFAYVASHDLQEPLRTVASFIQLLKESHGEKLDEDGREYIYYAVDGTERMQRMINDLLAYSRVGTRGEPFELIAADTVLEQTIANLGLTIEESSAEITHEHLPEIHADQTQIAQVFQNLISNAIRFRSKDPPRIHVAARRQDGCWEFSVRDNGIGINPRFFDRIFQIFQHLNKKRDYPGTGIGLALCKRIVERHGGEIWVESVEGEGSTFYFTVPD